MRLTDSTVTSRIIWSTGTLFWSTANAMAWIDTVGRADGTVTCSSSPTIFTETSVISNATAMLANHSGTYWLVTSRTSPSRVANATYSVLTRVVLTVTIDTTSNTFG